MTNQHEHTGGADCPVCAESNRVGMAINALIQTSSLDGPDTIMVLAKLLGTGAAVMAKQGHETEALASVCELVQGYAGAARAVAPAMHLSPANKYTH